MNQIGHNITADLQSQISAIETELLEVTSVDGSNASTVKDLIDRAKALVKQVEEARKEAKEPHLEAGRQVDATYNPLKEQIAEAYKPAHGMLQAWTVAEKKRKEKEAEEARKEAERLAAEQAEEDAFLRADPSVVAEANTAAAHAENQVKAASRVTSASGGRASGLRVHRFAEVTDGQSLVAHFWEHPDVLGAATKLANAQIRAAKGGPVNIPGVTVKEEERLA